MLTLGYCVAGMECSRPRPHALLRHPRPQGPKEKDVSSPDLGLFYSWGEQRLRVHKLNRGGPWAEGWRMSPVWVC